MLKVCFRVKIINKEYINRCNVWFIILIVWDIFILIFNWKEKCRICVCEFYKRKCYGDNGVFIK